MPARVRRPVAHDVARLRRRQDVRNYIDEFFELSIAAAGWWIAHERYHVRRPRRRAGTLRGDADPMARVGIASWRGAGARDRTAMSGSHRTFATPVLRRRGRRTHGLVRAGNAGRDATPFLWQATAMVPIHRPPRSTCPSSARMTSRWRRRSTCTQADGTIPLQFPFSGTVFGRVSRASPSSRCRDREERRHARPSGDLIRSGTFRTLGGCDWTATPSTLARTARTRPTRIR